MTSGVLCRSMSLRAVSRLPAFSCSTRTCARSAKLSSAVRRGRARLPALKTTMVGCDGAHATRNAASTAHRSEIGRARLSAGLAGRIRKVAWRSNLAKLRRPRNTSQHAHACDRPAGSACSTRHSLFPSTVAYIASAPAPRTLPFLPMSDFAIELDHVVKRYDLHVAVRDLSLRVPAGTVYGLLGPNGAGKTTTLRMILDVIAPDEGTIRVMGRPNSAKGAIDRVGYLPEERGLYRRMQVRRVLRFLAELKGISRG